MDNPQPDDSQPEIVMKPDTPQKSQEDVNRDKSRDANNDSMEGKGTESIQESKEEHPIDTQQKSEEHGNCDNAGETNNDSKEKETESSQESKGFSTTSTGSSNMSVEGIHAGDQGYEEHPIDTQQKSEEHGNCDNAGETNNDSKEKETESSQESKGFSATSTGSSNMSVEGIHAGDQGYEEHPIDTQQKSEEHGNRDNAGDTNNDSKEKETESSQESKDDSQPEIVMKPDTPQKSQEHVNCDKSRDTNNDSMEGKETESIQESKGFSTTPTGSSNMSVEEIHAEDQEEHPIDTQQKSEEHGNRDNAGDTNNDSKEKETESSQESKDQSGMEIKETHAGDQGNGNKKAWVLAGVILLLAVSLHAFSSQSRPEQKEVRPVDVFLKELEMIKSKFPTQRPELWRRGRIHLGKHLQMDRPTEPVSLILTAGRKAEKTLHCLARGLASAFSSALNASVLHIDGASQAHLESDQVKLDIDSQLRGAFEGDKPVAVIHRFEELPPGSTLIFYRYCDHENAAYKKIFLIFTVLLAGEEELPTKLSLSTVEEMVDDHLKNKFLSAGHPITFDRMDLDKYSGLWSRVSHLILPVASEETMEPEGCQET